MCNSVLIKSAVQKSAVGGAKNGGRGLEKNPYPWKVMVFKNNNFKNNHGLHLNFRSINFQTIILTESEGEQISE